MDLEIIINERAKIFDRALNGNLTKREPETFYEALRYIPLSGGKRLRPFISMLSCEAVGGLPETTIPFSIALEYMHSSTLVHDDIIDGDKIRRGLPTTHEKFGLPYAIVAGDALIGETYRMLSYLAPPEMESYQYKEIIRSIADAAKNFYEGEAMDIDFTNRYDVSIPEYLRMIEKKTAQLYWLAGKGGALIGRGNRRQIDNLGEWGKLFGIIFQIKDDLLNILTEQEPLGKQTIGSDILNGKRTLMAVHSLLNVNNRDKKKLISILGNKKATQDDVLKVIDIFEKTESIKFAEKKLLDYQKRAITCIDVLDESDEKELFLKLIDYGVYRSF